MGVNYFTDKQIQELQLNPYVAKVSNKAITYSEAFKEHFNEEVLKGKFPTQIFKEAGFDSMALGEPRISGFARRIRKMSQRPEGYTDQRSQASGRPRTVDRTTEQELAYLRHQVALQKQQIDALKKTNAINRKAARATHKKNSNSSKP